MASCMYPKLSRLPTTLIALALGGSLTLMSPATLAADNAKGASSSQDMAVWNPKPEADDVLVPMPCGAYMAFRKIYTGNDGKLKDRSFDAGSLNTEALLSQAPNHRYIQGAFLDEKGYYYLIGKYELNQAQYKILKGYNQGKGKCANTKFSIKDRVAQGNLSWFDAIELTRQYSYFLASAEASKVANANSSKQVVIPNSVSGVKKGSGKLPSGAVVSFARLPTDSEWEFAARGGLEVTSSQFNADIFPLGEGSGVDGNVADYAWYKGQDSAMDGKVRVTGLKLPNPLGLYDILGNVNEIVLDPFYATRTGRLHGQSGGFIVRGGSVMSTKSDMTTSYRSERAYFSRTKETTGKDTGMRMVLSLPFTTSIKEVRELNEAVQQLGMDTEEGEVNTVAALDKILKEQKETEAALERERKQSQEIQATLDEAISQASEEVAALLSQQKKLSASNQELKKSISTLTDSLSSLRAQMIEANTKRDEMRDRAIVSSLRLGGYLCSAIASQQIALERNERNEQLIRKIQLPSCRQDAQSDKCKRDTAKQDETLAANRRLAKSMVDFYVSYYADHINDILSTFDLRHVNAQRENAMLSLGNSRSSLEDYISLFVDNVKDYKSGSRNLKANHEKWIKQCRSIKK